MSVYLVDIQAQVDLTFTNALGYNNTFRTTFATWIDTNMVPLVDPLNPTGDKAWAIASTFATASPANYNIVIGDTKRLMYNTAEYAVNLVFNNSTNPATAARIFSAYFTQTGVDNPIMTIISSNIGGAAPVATRVGVGEYNVTFPAGSFPDLTKINRLWKACFAPVGDFAGIARFQVVSATVLKILTYKTGVVGADVVYTASDAILNETDCEITVYP